MYKIYSCNGWGKENFHALYEYEGTYETVGKAIVALEEIDPLGYGYIYDIEHEEVTHLINISYGNCEMATHLGYTKREDRITELNETMDYIVELNKKEE